MVKGWGSPYLTMGGEGIGRTEANINPTGPPVAALGSLPEQAGGHSESSRAGNPSETLTWIAVVGGIGMTY